MDLFVKPMFEPAESAGAEIGVQIAKVLPGLVHELGGVKVAERVGRKVAEAAHAPMDVLQAALRFVGRGKLEELLELVIPGARNVRWFQVARDQRLLQLEAQNNVHVI